MMNRRKFSSLALLAAACGHARAASATTARAGVPTGLHRELARELRELEHRSGGRLGVHIVDTATGAEFGQRADERFLMCSTFKMLAAALILQRVDRGQESLDRRIVFGTADLVPWSPVTEQHVGGAGMTLAELCEATLTTSDNTAANLILASYGGPPAFTAFARALGDTVTRLDRIEPALNRWRDATSDTTSLRAMLQSLRRVALGDALAQALRELLQRWMRANTTGAQRLKAGLPAGWTLADKTGSSSDNGTSNDIGIVWPPERAPLLVAAYLTRSTASSTRRDATLAKVGALLPVIVDALRTH